jgi:uncharacterized protein (TIGR03437 family)
VGHQRREDQLNANAVDYTYSDAFSVKADGTYSTPDTRYVVGAGGAIRIGSGIGPFPGISVALAAPSLSGPGVFLDPQKVVNAASFAPFTASLAPGEFIALGGTNLASDTQVAPDVPFPTTLAGVQVMINGIAAPLYYVTPGQIAAIVPYGATAAIAQIQVINNGVPSNTVTAFIGLTAPGVFTVSQNGLGGGKIVHSDSTPVTSDSPAKVGETVSVFLTGLGAVTPTIPDGAAGPLDPYSLANSTITAYVGGIPAVVGYAGLAPGAAGMYQVNLTIPTGVTTGNNALDISCSLPATSLDAYTSEATIAVTTTSSADSPAVSQLVAPRMRHSTTPARPHSPGLPDRRRQ